jgi:hypothetical protein
MAFGMWWLGRGEAAARKAGEVYAGGAGVALVIDEKTRQQATAAGDFDPAEIDHGKRSASEPPFILATLPLVVVILINFPMSLVVLPRLDFSFPTRSSQRSPLGPDRRHRQLPAFARLARKPGCWRQFLSLADPDCRQPRWLRRRNCSSACIRSSAGRGVADSGRTTGFARCRHERARRPHWYRFGRDGDRTQCIR